MSTDPLRCPPRRHSWWRRSLVESVERLAAAAGGRHLYRRRHLVAGRLRERREVVRVPGLPAPLEGFRIAHLSDLHGGRFLRGGDLGAVVSAVNAGAPDLCAITGDFVTSRWTEALDLLPDLARLRARHGVFAVFGNHDYHGRDEGRIAAACAGAGIAVLRNQNRRLEPPLEALVLSGLEDLEEARRVDVAAARAGVGPADVEVLLCHNPARAARLARPGCAAILSGHTHGGQVDLPLLRGWGPPHPGGRVDHDGTALIVSSGLGVIGFPLRIGVPAEVVWIVLERGGGNDKL